MIWAGKPVNSRVCFLKSMSWLNDVYGTADTVATQTACAPRLSEEQNAKYRQRYDKTVYTYYVNQVTSLSFTVREGIIREIMIYTTD